MNNKNKEIKSNHNIQSEIKLTDKQRRFTQEYPIDFNATQAAIRAGYSEKTARQQGQRMLSNVYIQKEIRKYMDGLTEKSGISVIQIIEALKKIAFSDVRKLFNDDGTMKNIKDLDDDIVMAIAGINIDEIVTKKDGFIGYSKKIKIDNRQVALEMLGKYLQMFKENFNLSGEIKHLFNFEGMTDKQLDDELNKYRKNKK